MHVPVGMHIMKTLKTIIDADADRCIGHGRLQLLDVAISGFEFDWDVSTRQPFGLHRSWFLMDLRPASRNHVSGKRQLPRSDASFAPADFVSVVRIARPSVATHKPIISCDRGNPGLLIVKDEGDTQGENLIPGSIQGGILEYEFDAVHHWSTEQAALYRSVVQPVVEQTLQGYHGSIIAIGAKGTGKRYIMRGGDEPNQPRSNRGAISRAAEQVFHCLNASRASARSLVVVVSYLSIASEELHDLLSDGTASTGMGATASSGTAARPMSRAGGCSRQAAVVLDEDGQLQGLSEHVVSCAGEVEGLLQRGNQRERKLQAAGYWRSSHAVFTITVEHRGGLGKDFAPISGVLRLVEVADWTPDAAASAAGLQTQQHSTRQPSEAPDESLVAFLRALDLAAAAGEGSRNSDEPAAAAAELAQASSSDGGSVLLRLLPGCIGGNSKTVLVWTVADGSQDSPTSRQVLAIAARCRGVRNSPNKRDLAEQALMNAYIRALRKKYRTLVFVDGNGASSDAPSLGTSSKQSKKKKWAASSSQLTRRTSRADDVIWNPTNAGRLSPTRSKPDVGAGDNGRRAASGAERFPEDAIDDTQSHGEREQPDASGDEYTFDDIGDTHPALPAESMSAEDAANILAAAATGYGYEAVDQEPEQQQEEPEDEEEHDAVEAEDSSELRALVASTSSNTDTVDLESNDNAELMESGRSAKPMHDSGSRLDEIDLQSSGADENLNSALACENCASAIDVGISCDDPSDISPLPGSTSPVRMRPPSTGSKSSKEIGTSRSRQSSGSKSSKEIATSRSRQSSAASRVVTQRQESVSRRSNRSSIKKESCSVAGSNHECGSTAEPDTAEVSVMNTVVPVSPVSSALLEENGFTAESIPALLGVINQAFGGLAAHDCLVSGSALVDHVHRHLLSDRATADRKLAAWMVQWILASGFIVEQSSNNPDALDGQLCDDQDTMYSMVAADEPIDPSYHTGEAAGTAAMYDPAMYSTPDPTVAVCGGYEAQGTSHAAVGVQELFEDELVYDYKTGQPCLPSPAESSKYISLDPFEPDQLVMNEDRLHPFHSACALAKNAGMLRNLAMMFGIEHCDSDQHTPLMYAVLGDKPSFIACLLECAAAPQKYDSFGCTALHHATRLGHIRSINTILGKVNPEQIVPLISQVDAEGLTVLHWAVRQNSESFLQLYLRHSLPGLVNTMDYCQQTPLYWAIAQRKVQHVKLLLKSHADPMVVDGHQTPASHLAIQCQAVSCLKVLLRQCPRLLDSKDGNGQTALHITCTERSLECFNVVLKATGKKGSGINATDSLHRTPLHCAVLSNSPALVQAVLQCKPGLLLKDVYGCTPLDCACSTSSLDCELLLRNAEANLKQSKGSAVCAVM